jgi:hypothetical protein
MASDEIEKQRAHERRRVLAELRAYESGVAEPIGVLEDLSLGGLRLATPKVIAVGVRKQLRVLLPAALDAGAALEFEAECRWLRANAKGPGFQCGFEFSENCLASLQPVLSAILRKL